MEDDGKKEIRIQDLGQLHVSGSMDIYGLSRWRYVLLFFSSRRRHTRYWRDWSSDVCSSDLSSLIVKRLPYFARQRSRYDSGRFHHAIVWIRDGCGGPGGRFCIGSFSSLALG